MIAQLQTRDEALIEHLIARGLRRSARGVEHDAKQTGDVMAAVDEFYYGRSLPSRNRAIPSGVIKTASQLLEALTGE